MEGKILKKKEQGFVKPLTTVSQRRQGPGTGTSSLSDGAHARAWPRSRGPGHKTERVLLVVKQFSSPRPTIPLATESTHTEIIVKNSLNLSLYLRLQLQ